MIFNFLALSEIPRGGEISKHLFLDVETTETGAALIVRGEDKILFPRAGAPLIYSYRDASPRAFVIASGGASELLAVHSAIVAAYRAGTVQAFAELPATPGALEVFAILAPIFPPCFYFDGNGTRRKCTTIDARNFSKARGRIAQPEKLNPAGRDTGAAAPSDDELSAMIAAAATPAAENALAEMVSDAQSRGEYDK